MFIDKYSQIYRILLPICTTISQIPDLEKKSALKNYIDTEFGGTDLLIREILCDFFRHGEEGAPSSQFLFLRYILLTDVIGLVWGSQGFDGSGADNSFDAGSCIDGRLTSAWNWCSSLEKKRYFHVFLLCGFTGFDGEW